MSIADLLAALTCLIHVYVFRLESLTWTTPSTRKIFNTTAEQAEHSRLLAFNQGFYNLFFSIAILAGWIVIAGFHRGVEGRTMIDVAMASAFGAGLVLLGSAGKKMWRPVLLQSGPPLLYFLARFTL